MKYLNRTIEPTLQSAATQFPVVFLTGPRQSGKTTLLRHLFQDHRYINLEDPEMRQWAEEQPKDFLQHHKWPLVIDEAQRVKNLFSYIQLSVDEHQQPGMYLLSGSHNFLLMESITQSLAGRSAVLSLLPFSYQELEPGEQDKETNQLMLQGFMPRVYQSITDISLFYRSYINTYVERDVRQMANIGSLNDFIRFIKLCAGRTGQLLNLSSLATEAGISFNTCKIWLSYLTTGYIVQLVQPYYKNYNKKLVKTPKLFFTDTGLLCQLMGIENMETLAIHAFRGAIFENLIYNELLKSRLNEGKNPDIWFWRNNHGVEIDFIIEEENKQIVIETKSGKNFHDDYLKNLRSYRQFNTDSSRMILVYDGDIERKIDDIQLLNWRSFSQR
ncbi:MAG: ATP-binding protein [Clostridia bacterium]|nr:ATP-binding protein [Clostridia bacterium]